MKKTFLCSLFAVVIFSLVQCGFGTTKIGDIKNSPRDYVDKEVAVSGTVTRTFSLLVIRYFTIQDKTGEITVVTERPLPREGQHLTVRGVVKEAFAIGSESLLVITETPESEKQHKKMGGIPFSLMEVPINVIGGSIIHSFAEGNFFVPG